TYYIKFGNNSVANLFAYLESYGDSHPSTEIATAIVLRISDTVRPAISGEENFVTSVDDPKSVSYFQNYISAYDETDGDLTNDIYVVTDNYTPNRFVLGTYEVIFGVKDTANNESTLKIYITVADVTKPVITGNSSKVSVSYTQTFNISSFMTTLSVTDNYAAMTNADIILESDPYTSSKT